MNKRLSLTQLHIRHFLECPRRFQLRYLAPFVWPEPPYSLETELAFDRGRAFHRLVERHFLGLDPQPATIEDTVIRLWWNAFESGRIGAPSGALFPEISLAVPVSRQQLFGRFDLLAISSTDGGDVTANVYDWKTSKAREVPWLTRAWQTRVYLALLAEGGHALVPGRTDKLDPVQLAMTYWYVGEPDKPRIVRYSRALHEQNWGEIQEIVAAIELAMETDNWPLTDDWSQCRNCAYQAYCGRQAEAVSGATFDDAGDSDDLDIEDTAFRLEPDWG